jgi:hypothetical protein
MAAPLSPQSAPTAEHGDTTRYPASVVPSITSLRLSPHGAEAKLVNISCMGLLAECTVRLKVGSSVTVLIEGGFKPASAAGRVARCEVSAMGRDGVLRYHVGIGFATPIDLKDYVPANAEPIDPPAPAAGSVVETPAAAAPSPAPAATVAAPGPATAVIEGPTIVATPPVVRNRW